jgi:hypothetical protein
VVTNVPMMFAFCLVIALVNLAVTLGFVSKGSFAVREKVRCLR